MMTTSLKRSPVPDEGEGSNKRIKTSATPPPSNFEEDLAFLQVSIIGHAPFQKLSSGYGRR